MMLQIILPLGGVNGVHSYVKTKGLATDNLCNKLIPN
jgi:hypothetical protein